MSTATLPVIKNANLKDIFANIGGAKFIGIDTLTPVKLTGGRKNPFQDRVTKASTGNSVQVFTNKKSNAYLNMVKRRLEKEGKDPDSFTLSPRKWGERIVGTPFVMHNEELYLEVIFLRSGQSTLLVDGLPYNNDIPGLPVEREPTGQAGLEDQVIIRTFKASSIIRVRVDGQEFVF